MQHFTVLIIGSGFAGTACAKYLESKGIECLIVEANDRTGGRTQTIHLEGNGDVDVDTGACFIHGTEGNPLMDLCYLHKVPFQLREGSGQTSLFFSAGEGLSYPEMNAVTNEFRSRYKKAKAFLREEYRAGRTDLSMEEGLKEIIRREPLSWNEESPKQFYFNFRKWIYEEYEGANWDEMSILQLEGGGFNGGNICLKHGYKSLLEKLQHNLNIQLNSEVKRVSYNGDVATVTVLDRVAKDYKTYQSKYIVCTASMGVLKESMLVQDELPENIPQGLFQFVPPLPLWKQESLDCYQIGIMDKVILQFENRFWGPLERITHVGKETGDFPWFDNIDCDPPALLAWTACRFADKCTKEYSEEQTVDHCMRVLRVAFPHAPNPIFSYVTRWRSNPYTRGAYSYIAKGATHEKIEKIALPVDNILFAGEAYSKDHIGCVHGAYITGIEAAQEIHTRETAG